MPSTPHEPDQDVTQSFKDGGQAILLELGRVLLDAEAARSCLATVGGSFEEKVAAVAAKQNEVEGFFQAHPKATMRRCVATRSGDCVDPRTCRIVGWLGAKMLLHGMDAVSLMDAARAISLTDDPAEILESRRLLAVWGTYGLIEDSGDRNGGLWHPKIRLSGNVMIRLLGGGECLPFVNKDVFTEVASNRRRRSGGQAKRKTAGAEKQTDAAALVRSIPVVTPREICKRLDGLGYVGQEQARKAVALAAYRHVERLRQIHVHGVPRDSLPPPSNTMCIGPTGCGKSHAMRLVFGSDLLHLPTAVLDATSFSETGYVGGDVGSIPTHLLLAAEGNVSVAELGVIVLDEADKLAEDGRGIHVSRQGVQRSLLKLLDPGTVEVPVNLDGQYWRQRKTPFDVSNLLWFACGAFSSLNACRAVTGGIGFSDAACEHTDGREAHLTAADFEKFGLLRELVGRFQCWVSFSELDRSQLTGILKKNAIRQRRRELTIHGIGLVVRKSAVELLVEQAMDRKTGARGIEAELSAALEDACYEAYSWESKGKTITVKAVNGEIAWDLSEACKRKGGKFMADEIEDIVNGAGGACA